MGKFNNPNLDRRSFFRISYFLAICVSVMFVITVILSFILLTSDHCRCNDSISSFQRELQEISTPIKNRTTHSVANNNGHRLAILVPFRDRFEELLTFVPYIHKYLQNQNIVHEIFILNQIDRYRFNRASLINVGYLFTQNNFDYIAMHDVDLLPINPNLSYSYPKEQPFHVAAPNLHPKYHYSTFVGGILLVNREQFMLVNGMSNKYWGWGLEDDEFYVRLREVGLNVTRPANITTGITDTFKHIHDKSHRKRDTVKCYNQREVTRKRDRQTGLNNVKYNLVSVKHMTIEECPFIVLNIELICDRVLTPWCDCSEKKNVEDVKRNKT